MPLVNLVLLVTHQSSIAPQIQLASHGLGHRGRPLRLWHDASVGAGFSPPSVALADRRLALDVAEGVLQLCVLVDDILSFLIIDVVVLIFCAHLSLFAYHGFARPHSRQISCVWAQESLLLPLHASPDGPEWLEIDHSRALRSATVWSLCKHRTPCHFVHRAHVPLEDRAVLVQEHIPDVLAAVCRLDWAVHQTLKRESLKSGHLHSHVQQLLIAGWIIPRVLRATCLEEWILGNLEEPPTLTAISLVDSDAVVSEHLSAEIGVALVVEVVILVTW